MYGHKRVEGGVGQSRAQIECLLPSYFCPPVSGQAPTGSSRFWPLPFFLLQVVLVLLVRSDLMLRPWFSHEGMVRLQIEVQRKFSSTSSIPSIHADYSSEIEAL